MPENADAMRFQRAAPWLRLRSGDYRVTYRPLTASELQTLGVARGRAGFLVARIVDRRELDEAVAKL